MSRIAEVTAAEIQGLRARRGWTQFQLAQALGTASVTVSRWERGMSQPRPVARARLLALGLRRVPRTEGRFVVDPTTNIRELDRILREQRELKRRARIAF